MSLIEGDPEYRLCWHIEPVNLTAEDFTYSLKGCSEVLPLGQQGYTYEQVDELNRLFRNSDFCSYVKPYTMKTYRADYAEAMTYANTATEKIKAML